MMKNNKGMSTLLMSISLGIATLFIIDYGVKFSLNAHQLESRDRRKDEVNLVAKNLQALLQNNEVWYQTISSPANPTFQCLRDNASCCGTADQRFVIADTEGRTYYDETLQGFNRQGSVCGNFGESDCTLRPEIKWSAANRGNSPLCHDVVLSVAMKAHGNDRLAQTFNMDLQSSVIYRDPSADSPGGAAPGSCADIQKANGLVVYGLTTVTSTSPWAALKTYCFVSRVGQAGYDFATSLGMSCFFYIDSSGDQRILCSGGYKDMDLSIAEGTQKGRYLAAPDGTETKVSCSSLGWVVKKVGSTTRCEAPNASKPGGEYLKQALNASFTYCKHRIGGKIGSGIPVWCEGNFLP